MGNWWEYEELPSGVPYDWGPAAGNQGEDPDDHRDYHLDLGCGTLPKARLGIDHQPHEKVGLVMDLNQLYTPIGPDSGNPPEKIAEMGFVVQGRLPFPDNSVKGIITHHCFEHIGDGFIRLMDECYRVLEPGEILRIIVPQFPSKAAVEDPDHKRYFMPGTFESFIGFEDNHWMESFSVPYARARFEKANFFASELAKPEDLFRADSPEIRISLRKRD